MRALLFAVLLLIGGSAMAQFAIYYVDEDYSTLSGAVNRNDLTTQEKQTATKIWNGGLKNWATAPFALSPTCDDPNTFPVTSRRVVINATGVTKQTMVDFLTSIAARVGANPGPGGYLLALAADVSQCATEPFP